MTDKTYQYDVFLSHNSKDKEAVKWLAERLEDEGELAVFLDAWNLVPGEPWQEDLEAALAQSETIAVFLGPAGVSSWHNKEMRDALNRQASDPSRRVIPVMLPGADLESAEVPAFLSQLTWVDFKNGLEDEQALHRLIAGIKGQAPGRGPGRSRPRRPAPKPAEKPAQETQQPQASRGVSIGSISGISGGTFNIAGRDVKQTVNTMGGDYVAGDKVISQQGIDPAAAFEAIYKKIAERPPDGNVDKEEIQDQVKKIEAEIQKGEEVREQTLDRWIKTLGEMAPDIFEVVVATLSSPLNGVALVVQKIAKKAAAG